MIQSQVILGDALMVFDSEDKSIGGATSHTLTITPEYTDITCKDAGMYGWKKLNKISWEIQTDSLYVGDNVSRYWMAMKNDEELNVSFGDGVGSSLTAGLTTASARHTKDNAPAINFTGKVKVTSFSLNAASGDVATYSVTLTGVGELQQTGSAGSAFV